MKTVIKRLTVLIMVVLLAMMCVACSKGETPIADRFVVVQEDTGLSKRYSILADKWTGVQYLYVYSGYGRGITPILNADGTPQIYDFGN